jgi:Poly A polymerase head domain
MSRFYSPNYSEIEQKIFETLNTINKIVFEEEPRTRSFELKNRFYPDKPCLNTCILVIGGWIRDKLINREEKSHDLDLLVEAKSFERVRELIFE